MAIPVEVSDLPARRPEAGRHCTIEDATSGVAEFPRIDSRYAGQRHRRVFTLTGSGEKEGWPLQRVACLHPESSVVDGWPYPRHQIPEEHVFVPRGDARVMAGCGPFLDVHRRATGLSVFEARRLADGPLWQGVFALPTATWTARYVRDHLKFQDRRQTIQPLLRETVWCESKALNGLEAE